MSSPVVARAVSAVGDAVHAIQADQAGASGGGSAINAISNNPDVPVIVGRGPGVLLDLRDSGGVSRFAVDQTGTVSNPGSTGDLTVTGGNAVIATAGKGLRIKEGSNATMGSLVLTGATPVVVATTAVSSTSRIFLTHNVVGGTPAFAWVSDRSPGISFEVTGTALDTSILAWLIVNTAT
jgi:hypothetical protein